MIECSLRHQPEYLCLQIKEDTKTRLGRYHSSVFTVKDGYPIAVYIDGFFKQYLKLGKTQEEIIKECIDYLNNQTEGVRKKKSQFGVLTIYQFSFKLNEETGEYSIIAVLTTNERQNKHFWGEGRK